MKIIERLENFLDLFNVPLIVFPNPRLGKTFVHNVVGAHFLQVFNAGFLGEFELMRLVPYVHLQNSTNLLSFLFLLLNQVRVQIVNRFGLLFLDNFLPG
jgi:hypothetical protein